jgi:hypothetical protein
MGRNIRTMFDEYLSYDAMATRIRARLGVDDQQLQSVQAKPCMAG